MYNYDVTGKTVLVTGSSKGLGKKIALTFAAHRYGIILHGRDEEALKEIKERVLECDVICDVVIGDITEDQTITDLAECASKRDIGILINNAGVYSYNTLSDISTEEIKNIMNVNMIAPALLTKKIFNIFKERNGGLIINVNSTAGKHFNEYEAAYSASKHGLRGFMGCFQYEALKFNIHVINAYLGAMNTDMVRNRSDKDKLINVIEVAQTFYEISQNYKSMRISEIDILRKIYK